MNKDSKQAYLRGLSPPARKLMVAAMGRPRAKPPKPDDLAGWGAIQQEAEDRALPACERALARFKPDLSERDFAGMTGIVIEPSERDHAAPPLLFIHGGGYVSHSARSSLFASVPLATDLGRTVISLDYPLAPVSRFTSTVPATAEALSCLLDEYPGASLAGDSAGGGLAVAACNRLLRERSGTFASMVLISPWTDLGNRGDSRLTQREHDPLLSYSPGLVDCAAAYAPEAVDDPDASPVLADYDRNFPPTLLICGTREILLSDSVRFARRLTEAEVRVVLDIHDGLHHSFPVVTPDTEEARRARATIRNFLDRLEGGHI